MSQNSNISQCTKNKSQGFIQIAQEMGIHTFRVDSYTYKDTTLKVKIPVSCAIPDSFKSDFEAYLGGFGKHRAKKQSYHPTQKVRGKHRAKKQSYLPTQKVRDRGIAYPICQNRTCNERLPGWILAVLPIFKKCLLLLSLCLMTHQ